MQWVLDLILVVNILIILALITKTYATKSI
jgi:hypothetical protein